LPTSTEATSLNIHKKLLIISNIHLAYKNAPLEKPVCTLQSPKSRNQVKWQTIEGMENLLNVWEYAAKNQIELVLNYKLLPNGPLPSNKCILPYAHDTQHKFQNPVPKI
jgi:hypothetical protein